MNLYIRTRKFVKIFMVLYANVRWQKCHAILLFLQNSTTGKVKICLKIRLFLNPLFHTFYPNYSNRISKQLFSFRNIKLVLNLELCKVKPNKHFLRDNFDKTAFLHKPDPVARWVGLTYKPRVGSTISKSIQSDAFNIQSNSPKWRRQPTETLHTC